MEQLKALCIHDISGIGRCSLTVISPVLSVMGIQCVPLPTAVLSSHLGGFGKVASCNLTNFCSEALQHYKSIGLSFNCMYSGYMANAQQMEIVKEAFSNSPKAIKICDPVMADNGKLYSSITKELIDGFKSLCSFSNIITPNTTEAAILLEKNYFKTEFSREEIKEMALQLEEKYGCSVVITGARVNGGAVICAVADKQAREYFEIVCNYIPAHFPGTGDIFCAVMAGGVLKGESLNIATEKAARFVEKCVKETWHSGVDTRYGVNLEANLKYLLD